MILEAKNVSFSYTDDDNLLFKNFNISVKSGEKVCLFAKSGYGKSTLAKILSGFEKPTTGEVLIDSKPLPKKGFSPVQLIFQHPEKAVNPNWRIRDILAESGDINYKLLERLNIKQDFLDKFPFEVSGGELQRICIARALQPQTKFLIADEITTMLDAITQVDIWNLVLEQTKDIGVIVITHNKFLADRICDKIYNLEDMC